MVLASYFFTTNLCKAKYFNLTILVVLSRARRRPLVAA